MRWPALAAIAAALVLGGCTSEPAARGELPGPVPTGVTYREPPAGAPAAPAFELRLIDGRALDMSQEWAKRPVVLVFFEAWCTTCRDQQPDINDLVADYRDVILFVGIASQSKLGEVEEYIAENEVSYPVGIDATGRHWLQYAVAEPPLIALISKGGRLLRGWPGGAAGDDLRAQIEQLVIDPG